MEANTHERVDLHDTFFVRNQTE